MAGQTVNKRTVNTPVANSCTLHVFVSDRCTNFRNRMFTYALLKGYDPSKYYV